MKKNKALFLDRDGVINVEKNYLHKIEDFEFLPHVFEACQYFQKQGYLIFIITNQAGIARGFYSDEDFKKLTTWMLSQFSKQGITIQNVQYCPHHPTAGETELTTDCECRKPKPAMIYKAIEGHNIALENSILIGDKISDINAGKAAGVATNILVKTGHTISIGDETKADLVIKDLSEINTITAKEHV